MQRIRPKWLALKGIPVFDDGVVRQDGPEPKKPKRGSQTSTANEKNEDADDKPVLLLRSDVMFEDGQIDCEVWLDHPTNKVQFRLGVFDKTITFAGVNMRGASYGVCHRDRNRHPDAPVAEELASRETPPPIGKWIPLQITVQGSLTELYIDGIRVARVQTQVVRAPLELVLSGYGKTQVRHITVSATKPQVFVVMQFTDEYNQLYREVIQPVCADFGYEVVRADNIYTNTLIVEDIAKSIREASLVIADITPNNPNVYYEVGFAHGIEKPTILLSDRKREKLPFDISGFRLLFYDNTIGGKSDVENALRKHLSALRA